MERLGLVVVGLAAFVAEHPSSTGPQGGRSRCGANSSTEDSGAVRMGAMMVEIAMTSTSRYMRRDGASIFVGAAEF